MVLGEPSYLRHCGLIRTAWAKQNLLWDPFISLCLKPDRKNLSPSKQPPPMETERYLQTQPSGQWRGSDAIEVTEAFLQGICQVLNDTEIPFCVSATPYRRTNIYLSCFKDIYPKTWTLGALFFPLPTTPPKHSGDSQNKYPDQSVFPETS